MLILAIIDTPWSDKKGAIVELSSDEVSIVLHGKPHYATGAIKRGGKIDIHERYNALITLEEKVQKSENIGDSLRAMADAVNAVVKAAKTAIVSPADEKTTELCHGGKVS